ncbi:class F sortase [Streptomyces thermospinosisporus]|uniref:Class F sortase n=1 Tax=Streptomyces thermospinosisporus TaxID=161482 RepID=A0ABN1YSR4_9ACTN
MAASPLAPADNEPPPRRRRLRAAMTALFWGAAALVLAVSLLGGGAEPPADNHVPHAPPAVSAENSVAPRSEKSAPSPAATAPSRPAPSAPAHKSMPRSAPVRLLVPKIAVDAPFTDLEVGASGQLQAPPPDDTNLVGWFAKGASPGEPGTAVVAGHVDTKTSPAVFARLSELKKGDRFRVVRKDGSKAVFQVYDKDYFDKDDFPDDRVYADTPDAQIRLITCAGMYDRAAKDYTENLVIFARLV